MELTLRETVTRRKILVLRESIVRCRFLKYYLPSWVTNTSLWCSQVYLLKPFKHLTFPANRYGGIPVTKEVVVIASHIGVKKGKMLDSITFNSSLLSPFFHL